MSKLKMLFQVVIILFGLMNLGAAVGFVLDSRERRNFLQRVQSPEVGFRVTPAGAWLWRFSLSPLRNELDAPSGSAVALSALLGIPVVRLRAALPDELLAWDLASALGRKHVCSVSGFNNSLLTLKSLLPALVSSSRRNIAASPWDGGKQKGTDAMGPPASPGLKDDDALSSHQLDKWRPIAAQRILSSRAETLEEFVGSALVLAFIQVAQLMPVRVLAAHVSAASVHFSGVTTPGAGRDFESVQTDFVTMLSPGILNVERRWLQRARLFKLILSQRADGSWDASSTTAFSLEARPSSETKRLPRKLGSRLRDALFGMAAAAEEAEDDEENALQAPGHGASSALDDAFSGTKHSEAEVSVSPPDAHPGLVDCPVTCSKEAIVDSMPRALRVLGPDVQATRVWCTLCCIAVLQRMNVSWIAGNGDLYAGPKEKTIVDSAFNWVSALAAEHPALAAALESGAVLKEARRVTAQWHSAFERRVGDLRRAKAVREEMSRSHAHRAFTSLTRAVTTKHDTLAVFLSACGYLVAVDRSRLRTCHPLRHLRRRAARRAAALAECVAVQAACPVLIPCADLRSCFPSVHDHNHTRV